MNPAPVLFDQSVPVADRSLAQVRGAGLTAASPFPRSDVAVILWDEQPKTKPAVNTSTGASDGSRTVRAAIVVR